jgi:hypothetical protein
VLHLDLPLAAAADGKQAAEPVAGPSELTAVLSDCMPLESGIPQDNLQNKPFPFAGDADKSFNRFQ